MMAKEAKDHAARTAMKIKFSIVYVEVVARNLNKRCGYGIF